MTVSRRLPVCVACGRTWLDPGERWRAFLLADDQVGVFCPDCVERQLGDVSGT
jgi:hypothetical protein